MKELTYWCEQHNKHVTAGQSFILGDIQYGNDFLETVTDQQLADLGIVQVVTIETVPTDYTNYNRSEQLIGAQRIVTWTRKSDSEIAAIKSANTLAEIEALERKEQLPRVIREFMLFEAEQKAAALAAQLTAEAAAQVPPGPAVTQAQVLAANFGYCKVKAFDDMIVNLRAQL